MTKTIAGPCPAYAAIRLAAAASARGSANSPKKSGSESISPPITELRITSTAAPGATSALKAMNRDPDEPSSPVEGLLLDRLDQLRPQPALRPVPGGICLRQRLVDLLLETHRPGLVLLRGSVDELRHRSELVRGRHRHRVPLVLEMDVEALMGDLGTGGYVGELEGLVAELGGLLPGDLDDARTGGVGGVVAAGLGLRPALARGSRPDRIRSLRTG